MKTNRVLIAIAAVLLVACISSMTRCSQYKDDCQYLEEEYNRVEEERSSMVHMTEVLNIYNTMPSTDNSEVAFYCVSQNSDIVVLKNVEHWYYKDGRTAVVFHK